MVNMTEIRHKEGKPCEMTYGARIVAVGSIGIRVNGGSGSDYVVPWSTIVDVEVIEQTTRR